MSNRFLLAIGGLFLVAACGGDDTGAETTDANLAGLTVIESPDGIASIAIDPSSLPESVSIDDVRIIAAVNDSGNTELPTVAVRLEPHGTTLSSPAIVTMQLPEPPDGAIMMIHQSGDYIQFLESTAEFGDDSLSITTDVGSFSTLSGYEFPLDSDLSLSPPTIGERESQTGVATISRTADEPTSFLLLEFNPSGTRSFRRVTVSPPTKITFDKAEVAWRFFNTWDPGYFEVEMSDGLAPWASPPVDAVCIAPNSNDANFRAIARFEVQLLDLAEPVSGLDELVISEAFALVFTQSEAGSAVQGAQSGDWESLLDAQNGDVWNPVAVLTAKTQTQCLALDEGGDGSENDSDSANDPDPPTGWSMTDPTDDWQAWGGFQPIIPERKADGVLARDAMEDADITNLEISSEGNTTTVDLRFGGNAQAVEAFARSDFRGEVVITLKDGTRREVIFTRDGKVKIVSAPSGMSVTRAWVQDDHLQLTITGLKVEPGATVDVAIQLGLFDGSSQDTVTLQT